MPETPELSDESPPGGVSVPAQITLFGFDGVSANARIEARSRGWRGRRAAAALAAGLIAAPLAALVPPHAPWALGALGIGLLTAHRRWAEEHTLHFLEGRLPPVRRGHHTLSPGPSPSSARDFLPILPVRVGDFGRSLNRPHLSGPRGTLFWAAMWTEASLLNPPEARLVSMSSVT